MEHFGHEAVFSSTPYFILTTYVRPLKWFCGILCVLCLMGGGSWYVPNIWKNARVMNSIEKLMNQRHLNVNFFPLFFAYAAKKIIITFKYHLNN